MAYARMSTEYKDCEKGAENWKGDISRPEDASNSNSGTSRQHEMRGLRRRHCWLLLVAVTVLISFAAVCGQGSPLSSPSRLHESLLESRSTSNTEGRAPQLLNVAAVEAVASTGCSSPHNVSIGTTEVVKLGDREYRLYFPVSYQSAKPAPLILSYHGGHRTAKWQEELDLLTSTYFNEDYIVVYPSGLNETWQGVPDVTTDDIGFTTDILDELESKYCIDKNRIYATGKSQGGGFAAMLACDATLSMRIAAYAPVSGAYYISDYGEVCDPETVVIKPCNPGRTNIPMLNFHGMNDSTISYMGGARKGGCLASIPHWVQSWAERDGLPLTNISLSVPGAESGSSAVMYEFGNGWQRGLVTHVMSGTNIGHDWPSTQPNSDNTGVGNVPATFNATSLILTYFRLHPLGWSFES